MRHTKGNQTERPSGGSGPDSVVTLLAAAGLPAVRVERCPQPDCPVCAGGRRVAA